MERWGGGGGMAGTLNGRGSQRGSTKVITEQIPGGGRLFATCI